MWAICGSVGFPAFCANAQLVERHMAATAAMRRMDIARSFGPARQARRGYIEVDIYFDEIGHHEVPKFSHSKRVPMSALGQKRTLCGVRSMSALPPKADIGTQSRNVRFVPKADSCTAAKRPCSIYLVGARQQ